MPKDIYYRDLTKKELERHMTQRIAREAAVQDKILILLFLIAIVGIAFI